VALARSLVLEPQLLVADEISSMLDPSTQANMIRMLKGLQNTKGFAMLFITHDLMLARKIADTIYVMRQGRIIQQGPVSGAFSYLTVRDGSRDTLIEK
jgi:peptide/nickel transport system ATP-binding protein